MLNNLRGTVGVEEKFPYPELSKHVRMMKWMRVAVG